LFEAYFDKDGEVRSRPKSEQITALFTPQDDPLFRPAVDWIRRRLAHVENCYLLLPSPHRPIRTLNIAFDDRGRVASINADDVALTEPYGEERLQPLFTEPLPPGSSYERLRDKLSRHFAMPKNQFELIPKFEGSREIALLQMKQWGPTSQLRFTPL
jgi:hypothetical protein